VEESIGGAVGANPGAPGAVAAGAAAGSVGGVVWLNEVSAKVSEQRVAVSNVFIDVEGRVLFTGPISDESLQLSPMSERRVEQNFSQLSISCFRVLEPTRIHRIIHARGM
jgi:hypothetical protein